MPSSLPDCYEADGVAHKVYGFTAILGYSRMRFVTFVKRADSPTLIRCLMEAFEYVGGVPQAVLTDRMKSVLLAMEDGQPHWHPVKSRLCRQSGRRAAGLQGVYATDKREGRTERRRHQIGVLARRPLHRSGRSQPPGAPLVRPAQWADPCHDTPTSRGALARGGVASAPNGLGLGALCRRGAQSELGGLSLLRWRALWLAQRATAGRQRGASPGTAWTTHRLGSRPTGPPGGQTRPLAGDRAASRPVPYRALRRRACRVAIPLGHQVSPPEVAQRPLQEYDRLCGVEVSA